MDAPYDFVTHRPIPVSFDGLTGFARRFRRAIEARREAARITRELQSYTDRELMDLGLCRSDIPEVAAGRFRRP